MIEPLYAVTNVQTIRRDREHCGVRKNLQPAQSQASRQKDATKEPTNEKLGKSESGATKRCRWHNNLAAISAEARDAHDMVPGKYWSIYIYLFIFAHLVHDHVLQLLVEHRPREDVVHQRLPSRAGRQHVLADVTIPSLHQSLLVDGIKTCSARNSSTNSTHWAFASQSLDRVETWHATVVIVARIWRSNLSHRPKR